MTVTTHSDQIAIRRASGDDVEAIEALTNAAYAKFVPRLGRKPLPMSADYPKMVAAQGVWVVCLSHAPVGVLVLTLEPESMLIYSVAVSPEHQGRGLGRRLLMWAEQQALDENRDLIRLYTNARMDENIALYRRLGYEELRREPHSGSVLVHMAKRLDKMRRPTTG